MTSQELGELGVDFRVKCTSRLHASGFPRNQIWLPRRVQRRESLQRLLPKRHSSLVLMGFPTMNYHGTVILPIVLQRC